jgi:hypothetical protein
MARIVGRAARRRIAREEPAAGPWPMARAWLFEGDV